MVRGKLSTDYRLLARTELPIDTISLARSLIGKILVRDTTEGLVSGRIVETEAYPVGDRAGYAYGGMTARNRSLMRLATSRLAGNSCIVSDQRALAR
jgi:3-methyladenine DNA glycosylase Mpg